MLDILNEGSIFSGSLRNAGIKVGPVYESVLEVRRTQAAKLVFRRDRVAWSCR
jgi:hypothetical protein